MSRADLLVADLNAVVELGLENCHTLGLRGELGLSRLDEGRRKGEDRETRPHSA